MASRHLRQATISQENPQKPFKALIQPVHKKREAFGDTGNELKNQANMGIKKPAALQPSKKENTMKEKPKVELNKAEKAIEKPKSNENSKLFSIPTVKNETRNNNAEMFEEYVSEVFTYLRELELKFVIQEKYMEGHKSTPSMRSILIDWLVEIHENFKMELETLYLCIQILDSYLMRNKMIDRSNLQLVGVTSLFIAAKYEECYMPSRSDFVYIGDDTFSEAQLFKMEREVIRKLEFNLNFPLPITFLKRYCNIKQVSRKEYLMAKYILELALLDYETCHVKPSLQAAAACCLSSAIFHEVLNASTVWTKNLEEFSKYDYNDLKSLVINYANLLLKAETSKYQAVKVKYARVKFGRISSNECLQGPLVKRLAKLQKLLK